MSLARLRILMIEDKFLNYNSLEGRGGEERRGESENDDSPLYSNRKKGAVSEGIE